MKQEILSKTDEEVNELLRHIEHVQLKAFTAEYAYLHDTKEWAVYLDTLLSRPKNDRWFGHSNYVLAQVYIEEHYWDRLLQLVKQSELSAIEAYEQYLKPRFPEQLRDIFVEKLILYADRNTGRNYYQYAAVILRKIRTCPEGNRIVDKLLTEFKIKYKARRAMMEELREV